MWNAGKAARRLLLSPFPEDEAEILGNIHDGVEGDDRSERFIAKVQSHHVSFTKSMSGFSRPSLLNMPAERSGRRRFLRVAQVAAT